jgi:hypothetical protein
VPFFAVNIDSPGLADLKLEIYNYDEMVKQITLAPRQKARIFLDNPHFKMLFNRFFYQFSIQVRRLNSRKMSLNIELYPIRKKQ